MIATLVALVTERQRRLAHHGATTCSPTCSGVPALPGVAIFLTSMAFNLLSDGLRDAMEIRM